MITNPPEIIASNIDKWFKLFGVTNIPDWINSQIFHYGIFALSALMFCITIVPAIYNWVQKVKLNKSAIQDIQSKSLFIPFKDALWQFGKETNLYYINRHDKLWENKIFNLSEGKFDQEKYYKLYLLSAKIEKDKLSLYGLKKFSKTKELEKIPEEYCNDDNLRAPEYNTIYSVLDESLYTDVSLKIKDLNTLIKQWEN